MARRFLSDQGRENPGKIGWMVFSMRDIAILLGFESVSVHPGIVIER